MKLTTFLIALLTGALVPNALFAQTIVASSPPPAGATKICAPWDPNNWVTVIPVPGTWSLDDCRNLGQAIGAKVVQVGCFFEKEPAGQTQKYIFGGIIDIASPPSNANVPNPNCGW
jgi:hypothetical protein